MGDTTKKMTVKAQLTVKNGYVEETHLSFDKAWHRALQLDRPVRVEFVKFARADTKTTVTRDTLFLDD